MASHQQAPPGPLKYNLNITQETQKPSWHSACRDITQRPWMTTGAVGAPIWSCIQRSQAPSPAADVLQRLGEDGCWEGTSCSALGQAQSVSSCPLRQQPGSQRQPANRILVLLGCCKLRAPPDSRLAMRHRSAGKAWRDSPVWTLPLLSVHSYKYTKPHWGPVEPFLGKCFLGSCSLPSVCAFIPVSRFTCQPLKTLAIIVSIPQISPTCQTFSKFSPVSSSCNTFLHLRVFFPLLF